MAVVIPFDAIERANWKAAHRSRGVDLDVLEKEMEAFTYFHESHRVAVATVCKKLHFTEPESIELFREVIAGDM